MSADRGAVPPDTGVLDVLRTPERRVDGVDKVTGTARYAADRAEPGTLWARFLLSPVAYARIVSIDASRARAMPGVHAVLTGADVKGQRFGRRLRDRPVLCWDRVLFVGDRLAAVAAETPEIAAAAVAAIRFDLEELPGLFDLEEAEEPGAPILHPEAATYDYAGGTRPAVPHPNVQGHRVVQLGAEDLEPLFGGAAHVFRHEFRLPRQHAAHLEPHVTLTRVGADGRLSVVTTNKAPFALRSQLAATLGLEQDRIDVDARLIGGDFGAKGYSLDEFACAHLARLTGRPVRTVTSYPEELGATSVRHAAVIRLRTAVDADGRLLAHEADVRFDGGAYAGAKPTPALIPGGGVAGLVAYRVPSLRIDLRSVYTNTVPGGHVRAPGEVQALFAGESHLDEIARALGVDPLEFRERNAVRPGEVGGAGDAFRETRAIEVLTAVRRHRRPRPSEEDRGWGMAMTARHVGGAGAFPLRATLTANGRVTVRTGVVDQGAGAPTVVARTLAAAAGISPDRITIVTDTTSQAAPDRGVGSSRTTHLASRSAALLGAAIRDWVDERLPLAVPSAPPTARVRDDALRDEATGTILAGWEALAAALVDANAPVEFEAAYDSATEEASEGHHDFAACAVEVAVDRRTGRLTILDALLVVDAGTIINPVAHRGQLEGGFVFGLGQATMEELRMDGPAVATRNLSELKLPNALDIPPLRIVILPTTVGPGAFGAKMAGELTNTTVAPAIANAIADAVGVRLTALPLTAERIHTALGAET